MKTPPTEHNMTLDHAIAALPVFAAKDELSAHARSLVATALDGFDPSTDGISNDIAAAWRKYSYGVTFPSYEVGRSDLEAERVALSWLAEVCYDISPARLSVAAGAMLGNLGCADAINAKHAIDALYVAAGRERALARVNALLKRRELNARLKAQAKAYKAQLVEARA